MNNLAKAEQIGFNADHARYYKQQEKEDRRAEQVEQRTKDLMQVGAEFHPWTFKLFEEAIENAPESDRKLMFACIAEAVSKGLNDNCANHLAMVSVRQLNERYWTKCAAIEAERQLEDEQ